jgi:hypothetical protein
VPPDGLLVIGTQVVARAARGRPSLDRSQPIPMIGPFLSSDRPGALTPVRRCDAGVKLRHNFESDQVRTAGKRC